FLFFFQAEDGIRDRNVTGVQTCALPICWLGRETAVPAAWLAAGSPFLVWYGQEARNYAMLVTLAGAGGALLLARGLPANHAAAGDAAPIAAPRGGARRTWLLYGLISLAALLTNFEIVLLAPLHVRWALAGRSVR